MARIKTSQAKKILAEMAVPVLEELGNTVGYSIPVYWDGLDASQSPDVAKIYADVNFTVTGSVPLALGFDSGTFKSFEFRIMLYATEKRGDHLACSEAADEFEEVYQRRRCAYNLIVNSSRFESIDIGQGRRIFNIVVIGRYEGF